MKHFKLAGTTLSALAVTCLFYSCEKTLVVPGEERALWISTTADNYNNDNYPQHLSFAFSSVDNDIAHLGRVLFYDELLSANSRISCASCHHQQKAFSDGMKLSNGFAMSSTTRNSMAISNPSMHGGFFWDARADELDEQVLMPITNHIEMGNTSVQTVVQRIKSKPYYNEFFINAFGDDNVTVERVSRSLAEFLSSLRSFRSAMDAAIPPTQGNVLWGQAESPDFPEQIQRDGFELFGNLQCASCHGGSNLGGSARGNIGLESNYTDAGMATWTNLTSDNGVFKVPSLRNIALTGPYMHDGRFETLAQVIDHYDHGVQSHPNLSWQLSVIADQDITSLLEMGLNPVTFMQDDAETDPQVLALFTLPRQMHLSEYDKNALLAFLNTLTDEAFITDPRYSDPFRSVAH